MVSPVAQAQPAELTPALTAHHVHAPLVLLYGPLALGAGLGVGQNPVGILALCTVLAQPHVHCLTIHLQLRIRGSESHGCLRCGFASSLSLNAVFDAHNADCAVAGVGLLANTVMHMVRQTTRKLHLVRSKMMPAAAGEAAQV